ncbi:MAG: adenylate kinase [Candidatus Scalinduaceae bacterium]
MRLVFLGPPGVGKGTQAESISLKKNIPHISSGDLLREAVEDRTEIGLKASEYIEKGLLVPDKLVVKVVVGKIITDQCNEGFVLDGFPRNLSQAKILDETLNKLGKKINKVFSFTAEKDIIIRRLAGRRICKSCGANYHEIFVPPAKDGVCDKCGSELYQRKDDNPKTISERLRVYREQTEGLIDYYRNNSKLTEINGNNNVSEIQDRILKELSLI